MTSKTKAQIVVQIESLVKIFSDKQGREHCVLPGISLKVSEGTLLTIVGPSGSGKTTLLNIIAGLEEKTSGTVKIGRGSDRPQLAYVFQSARLLPWLTVEENLRFVKPENTTEESFKEKIHRYLDLVGLNDVTRHYPHQLSGGMQQRAGIARALCIEPAVLLMDEPFSHLDEITAEQMRVELLRIWENTRQTIIFITHDMQEAITLGDRLIMLNFLGEITEDLAVELHRPRKFSDRSFIEFYARSVEKFQSIRKKE
ncbi:MAG: ABC transporter ATP-binding protein [Pseudomonadota bacterium]|nr:ABC transporter ATP-binding protein [Pseudomonadota bacterium]